jgi:hypothetical protein
MFVVVCFLRIMNTTELPVRLMTMAGMKSESARGSGFKTSQFFSSTSPFFLAKHRLHTFLQFFRLDVLLVRGDPPEMAKRIFQLAGAIAVELIRDGLAFLGAGGNGLLKNASAFST